MFGRGRVRGGDGRRTAEGILRPVDYTARTTYRPPPALYARMQWLGPLVTRLGLAPRYVVVVEVPGRRTGITRRTTVVRVDHRDGAYVVALAGESEWVRNVRAAGGRVTVRTRRGRAATLVEVPVPERAEVIRAYLTRPGRGGTRRVRVGEARSYFGVGEDASLAEITAIAEHYPVFRIVPEAE